MNKLKRKKIEKLWMGIQVDGYGNTSYMGEPPSMGAVYLKINEIINVLNDLKQEQ